MCIRDRVVGDCGQVRAVPLVNTENMLFTVKESLDFKYLQFIGIFELQSK